MSLQEPEAGEQQAEPTVIRNGQKRVNGRWAKGQSGNPEGSRSRKHAYDNVDIAALAKAKTRVSINALAGIVTDGDAPPAARVSAACALLERGWGKPKQQVEVSGNLEHFIADVVRGLDRVIEGEAKEIKDLPAPDGQNGDS